MVLAPCQGWAEPDRVKAALGMAFRYEIRRVYNRSLFAINYERWTSLDSIDLASTTDRLASHINSIRAEWVPLLSRSLCMPSKIAKLRDQAFERQGGLCCYCSSPMCSGSLEVFASRLNLSLRYARRFLCTAEHLCAVQDGGKDTADNIVAACAFCNATRHRSKHPLHPEAYRRHVASKVRQGKWHARCSRPYRPGSVSAPGKSRAP